MKVLIIEDDPTLNRNISDALSSEHYQIESVFDGLLAERMLKKDSFGCVIMDVNLPGKNGFELCKDFRNYNKVTPIIMLTAFGELGDKVQGFSSGADDYLTKPFYMRELILRVNSLVKRNAQLNEGNPENSILVADDITVNDGTKTVFRKGEEIVLTPREYQILMKLMRKKGEIVSKSDLIKEIWGSSFDTNTNTVEVYVNFLRKKLDKPFSKQTIKTKVGYGYYLDIK